MQQDTFDRHQVTVCDTRSKLHAHISTNVRLNDVKKTRRSTSRTLPGGRSSMQQDTFHRQQVTVCNTQSKVLIATWNLRNMHQSRKLENIFKNKSYESGYTRSRRIEMAEVREVTK